MAKVTKKRTTKCKIRKGDEVIVITGKYAGKTGEVSAVLSNNRLKVMGVNLVKKHMRPDPNRQQQGGIVEIEAPIHMSNVAIYNPVSKKADRIGYKFLEDGRKVRIFKSSGEVVDI